MNKIDYHKKVKSHIESLGYSVDIPTDFIYKKTKLRIVCKNGHESLRKYERICLSPDCHMCKVNTKSDWYNNLKFNNVNAIEKTSRCSAKVFDTKIKEMSISQICQRWNINPFDLYKYKVISEYHKSKRNDRTKYIVMCENNHTFITNRRYLLEGYGCKLCSNNSISVAEQIMSQWIENAGLTALLKHVINDIEFDIYVPDKRVAIDYCGMKWHSENEKSESSIYLHQNKMIKAFNNNIHLITVFESDFNRNRDRIKEIVSDALSGVLSNTKDLRYRKLSNNEKYSEPMPHYYTRNCVELDDFDDLRKFYTVYDCGHLI